MIFVLLLRLKEVRSISNNCYNMLFTCYWNFLKYQNYKVTNLRFAIKILYIYNGVSSLETRMISSETYGKFLVWRLFPVLTFNVLLIKRE